MVESLANSFVGPRKSALEKFAENVEETSPKVANLQRARGVEVRGESGESSKSFSEETGMSSARVESKREIPPDLPNPTIPSARSEPFASVRSSADAPFAATNELANQEPPPQEHIRAAAHAPVSNAIEQILSQGRIVKEVTLEVGDTLNGLVRLHIVERQGEVEVAVRTPDPEVRAMANERLPELLHRLDDAGYQTEGFGHAAVEPERQRGASGEPVNSASEARNGLDWQFQQQQRRQSPGQRRANRQNPPSRNRAVGSLFEIASLVARAA